MRSLSTICQPQICDAIQGSGMTCIALVKLEHFPITLHRILRRSDSYGIRLA